METVLDREQKETLKAEPEATNDSKGCQCCTIFTPDRKIKRGYETLKIDVHAHILPEVIPNFREQFGYGQFVSLKKTDKKGISHMWQGDKFFREVDDKSWSCEARLVDMDSDNVQVQVLSTVPVMFSYWAKPHDTLRVAQFLNDDIANRCKQYPTRFVGLGTLPMQSIPLAIQELRRCILELGLVGIQIGSHIEKWNLDDEIFFPLWKEGNKKTTFAK
ncbi:amidohydrolase 2 [Reticulomyxa filosa]|uniref:2-amino-3-carboxymuconate-6-semialdehyde decarboxylase n=1 Tax=Reticulomyxa filosa TaxID=46433 RepID=X6M9S3_RETFI|nr:amidohydrolase 2 [Reticulomyxa filosa]|eukprot:ETO10232.1 amidohydrolase 2 [Reticulomyxa filosa]